jgi:transposase InsO family protein
MREAEDELFLEEIREIHERSRKTYGSPRVHAEMHEKGYVIGHNRVARLMKKNKIRSKVKKKFKVTTHSKHGQPVAKNLLKDIKVKKSNEAWVSDITYIRTVEGWLYLCVIMDLYSRNIVGWSMGDRLKKELVIKSLDMAYARRRPEGGVIFHSDRGSQYASGGFRRSLMQKDCFSLVKEKIQ